MSPSNYAAAPPTGRQTPAAGPTRAKLKKLATAGDISKTGHGSKRAAQGDEAITRFDEALSDTDLELLKMVADGKKLNARTSGFTKLVQTRLVYISFSLENRLSEAGQSVISKGVSG